MDFLNKAFAQVADLFKSMTPAARITAGLLLAVVLVGIGYLFTHQVTGGDAYLLGGQHFTASELPAMEAAFGKAGLSGYTVEGSRIRIPQGQQAAYMGALADAGALPAHFGDYLTDATVKVGPFTSRTQQDEMIKVAKQKELALIIRSMSGIENAAVHYDTQRKSGLRPGTVTTASVSVKPQGTQPLSDKQVPMIRHLVAGAIAGLSPDSVTVVDLNGRTYVGGKTDGLGSALEDPYLQRMKEYQAEYETKIYNALSSIAGVTVTANVELNKELHLRTEKDTVDPKAIAPVNSREETSTSLSKAGGPGGRPGIVSQQPNQPANLQAASSGNEQSEDKSVTETQNAVGRDRTVTDLAGLTPKRVTVSIGVPSSYYDRIWRQRNPVPAGEKEAAPDKDALLAIEKEETDKIRAHVAGILPPPASPEDPPISLVTVTTFAHVTGEAISGPAVVDRALAWLGNHWSTLGMLGLVGFSLLVLRSTLKAVPAPVAETLPRELPLPVEDEAGETAEGEASAKPKNRLKRRLGSGPSLRDELAEMVREDPDAAANILRGWIGNTN